MKGKLRKDLNMVMEDTIILTETAMKDFGTMITNMDMAYKEIISLVNSTLEIGPKDFLMVQENSFFLLGTNTKEFLSMEKNMALVISITQKILISRVLGLMTKLSIMENLDTAMEICIRDNLKIV